MADIRINALTSTAATTASDDYLAVDGSANGTRKLSAFSPTFGGNLTVGGGANLTSSSLNSYIYDGTGWVWTSTGTSGGTVKGGIYAAGGLLFLTANSSLATNRFSLNSSGDATIAGNLTVSGDGLNTFGGIGAVNASILFGASNVANASAGYLSISQRLNYGFALFGYNMTGTSGSDAYTSPKNATGSAGVELIGGSLGITRFIYSTAATTAGNALTVTEAARFSSGNLLLGTTTDSGNGKLQLATGAADKTSGIGFSSDTSLYRYQGGRIALDHLGGSLPVFSFLTNGTTRFSVYANGTTGTLETSNGSIQLATSGAIALTLDTSQNATFANGLVVGKAASVNTITGGDAGGGTYIIQFKDGLGAAKVNITGDGKTILLNTTASTSTTTGALQVSGGVGVAGNVNAGGNLTVSGTGNGITIAPTAGAANLVINGAAAGSTINFAESGTNKYTLEYVSASNFWSIGRSGVAYDLVLKSGNLLLGTTTDSGNGKLQLATHTTSAGGIGFGTDMALYRYAGGIIGLDHIGGSVPGLNLLANGTRIISIYGASNSLYLDTFNAAGAMYLRTGAQTTALTLDSSQNATFAGTVTASKAGTAFYSIESTVNGAISEVIVKGKNSTGTAREARLGLNKYADDVFSIYDGTTERFRLGLTNGDATFAGSIRQNQANNISLTSGVATTIFSLGTSAGVYIVTATLDVNAVAGYAIVGKGATGTWQVLANSGTQMSFSMSTNDLQITQSSGATSTTNTFNLLRLR